MTTKIMEKPKIKHRGNPTWYKGMPSPNPNARTANLKGRPKLEDCLLDCLRFELKSFVPGTKITHEQMIAKAVIMKADRGDPWAVNFIAEYMIVKPKTEVDVNVKHTPQELSDEQLAVIAATQIITQARERSATNILRNNARNGSRGVIKAEASPA